MKAIEIKITIPYSEYKEWWGYQKQGIDKTLTDLKIDIETALTTKCDLSKFEIEADETEN
jgi:hypothetical protein